MIFLLRLNVIDTLREIINKNLHRSIRYSLSGYVGFAVVEAMTYLLFNFLHLHNLLAVSPAFLVGIAVEFIFDEFWTTKNQGVHEGSLLGLLHRLSKFELLNLLGTAVAIATQYILFLEFGLEPLLGNIAGSALAFPVNYVIQMRITWKIRLRD